MYQTPSIETMPQDDYQQHFEAAPQKSLSFREKFNETLNSRRIKVNISADKISKVYDIHTREEMHPAAVNAFTPKFAHELLKEHIPETVMTGPLSVFDRNDALSGTGIVGVEKIDQKQTHYDPKNEGYLADTHESRQSAAMSEARARIASFPFAA